MTSFYRIRLQIRKQSSLRETQASANHEFPRSLLDPLPSHSAAPISKRRDTLHSGGNRDYRYGPIRIDWLDFEVMSSSDNKQTASRNTPVALFVPSSPSTSGTTNLPDGVVHIFRESTQDGYPAAAASTSKTVASGTPLNAASTSSEHASRVTSDPDSAIVAVLAVPPWMAPSDFLAFVAPAAEGMKHLRLIRDVSPNRTMVVIQFRDTAHSTEFIEEFNGKQFNSIEPETCSIVHVRSVEIDTDDAVSHIVNASAANPSSMHELPTCPVCLDRMDAKWGDSRCPVCRYSQIALSSNSSSGFSYAPTPAGARLASCTECDSRINLWICLICGNVGCGRQGRAHAKGHYELASHRYAMELATQRVWDYAGDNYVHRLIQNKADGKLVELPSAAGMDEPNGNGHGRGHAGQGPGDDDNLKAEKMEILAMQYSQILQRAMEDQRAAYDEQTGELRRKLEDTQRKLEIVSEDAAREVREARAEQERRRAEEAERQVQLEREKAKAERKAEKMGELARRLEKELKEERTVSEGLLSNLTNMKEKIEVADKDRNDLAAKVTDLEEQMRDLMFFLEAREKIEQGGGVVSEAAGGSIELPQPSPSRSGKTAKKKKKK
ncbi:hypothetical protein M0805_006530 [Coniferiporia weirii]|nr:hypothetical protein M0805_006530 [Coniferiporia weirii]